jgi:hypothetical protein
MTVAEFSLAVEEDRRDQERFGHETGEVVLGWDGRMTADGTEGKGTANEFPHGQRDWW